MSIMARIAHRKALMGGYPDLSMDFPLSVLLARGLIDQTQHDAGMHFGALYCRVFGAPHASGPSWAKMIPEEGEPRLRLPGPVDGRPRDEAEYAASIATLDEQPDRHLARQLVHQLAVHLIRDWYVVDILTRRPFTERHRRRTNAIRSALSALYNREPVRVSEVTENPLGISRKGEPMPRLLVVGQFE